MARACPDCGRPNGDRAPKCLYCTAPLPPAETAEPAVPEPLAAETSASDRHLVILLPGGAGASSVKELARLAGISAYDARMHLSNRHPRLFRRIATAEEARGLSTAFSAAGIPHYTVAETSVLSVPVTRARQLELHERHVSFVLEGAPLVLPYEDLLLLVRGEIHRERHNEKRLGTARGASHRVTPGLRLHVYPREASVAAEIDPERLDWDVLGEERTASALVNLQRLLTRLLERAPSAELDRGFDDEPAVLSRAGTGEGEDVSSALASTSKERSSEGIVYDNAAQFRYYSRWRYRLSRHLARRGGPGA